jgi:hypothetical protein
MSARFFQPKSIQALNPINLIQDVMRLVRDAVAVVNDFLGLQWLNILIQFVNGVLGDKNSDRYEVNSQS